EEGVAGPSRNGSALVSDVPSELCWSPGLDGGLLEPFCSGTTPPWVEPVSPVLPDDELPLLPDDELPLLPDDELPPVDWGTAGAAPALDPLSTLPDAGGWDCDSTGAPITSEPVTGCPPMTAPGSPASGGAVGCAVGVLVAVGVGVGSSATATDSPLSTPGWTSDPAGSVAPSSSVMLTVRATGGWTGSSVALSTG